MGTGAAVAVPFTVSLAVGEVRSLLRIVSVEYFVPAEVGVKVTVTFWLAPAATVKAVGLIVNWPSAEVMPVTISGKAPLFSMVIVREAEAPTEAEPMRRKGVQEGQRF